ncbi:MAG: hypothetical protein HYR67_05235 [Bacteroidetes bacterium]|nr:hypothetical protein [Bacteroidota bacterium]
MKFLITTLAVICLVQFSGCKPDSPSPQGPTKALMGSWVLQSALVDNVDQTSTYQGLTLTFTATTYTSTNGKAVWPASGTWTFVSPNGKTIKRDDGLLIDIVEISSTKLKLSFIWANTTLGGGRESSVGGQNVFTLTKG